MQMGLITLTCSPVVNLVAVADSLAGEVHEHLPNGGC